MKAPLDSGGKIVRGNLTYLPVVPGRLEFALHVRRLLLENRPAVVAVELPSALERQYRVVLERLPRMSVLFCSEDSRTGDEEQAAYIPIEPGDPFIEALRTASELNATLVFLQGSSREAAQSESPYPPSYAAEIIGVDRYVEAYRLYPPARTPAISEMASGMAWKLQGADPLADTAWWFRSGCSIRFSMLWSCRRKNRRPSARPCSIPPRFLTCIPIAWSKSRMKCRIIRSSMNVSASVMLRRGTSTGHVGNSIFFGWRKRSIR